MESETLELLKEIKQGQEETNLRLEQFKQSQIRIEGEIADINRSINLIEMITAKNWGDVICLKRWRDEQEEVNKPEYLTELKRENNIADTLKFIKNKMQNIEEDVFFLKAKITKQE